MITFNTSTISIDGSVIPREVLCGLSLRAPYDSEVGTLEAPRLLGSLAFLPPPSRSRGDTRTGRVFRSPFGDIPVRNVAQV
jgi:hypothetical protein